MISIALATFNGARFLSRQLDSLIAQETPPAELVVTDDGSTDDTRQILELYVSRAAFPIHIHPNEARLGYRANFMKAARLCRSPLVAFCDQDDYWLPNKLTKITAAFRQQETQLVYHNAAVVDVDEREYATLYMPAEQKRQLDQRPVPPWLFAQGFTQTFRRDLQRFDDLWPGSKDHMANAVMAHDQWYFFLASAFGGVTFEPAKLARYRQHGGNAFGAAPTSSPLRGFIKLSAHSPEGDELRANAAESRGQILAHVSERCPEQAKRLRDLSASYLTMAQRFRRRQCTYGAEDVSSRFHAWGNAAKRGDYRGAPWRFRRGSLARDFIGGVMLGGRRS